MSIFADACALIVYFGETGQDMSRRGQAIMRDCEVLVSAITVWEITRKLQSGRLPPLASARAQDFCGCLREAGFRLMPLSARQAEAANALPPHHAHPMDRTLIAQALAKGSAVVTRDRIFEAYGVEAVW